jgi:hypothetical protein
MAYGGGTFIAQNKVLPGTYINFVSAASSSAALSDRGIAAIGITTGWGVSGDIFSVTSEDFQKHSTELFGSDITSDELKGLRDIFMNARTVYCYRLDGGGAKASCTYATAKYAGTKGNSLKIVITANVDDSEKFDVATVYGTQTVDTQTGVASASELVNNTWVDFISTATLAVTAGTALTGGTDGTVNGTAHQTFLDKLEAYNFNALGCNSAESTIKALYVNYCKRLRDELGKKFQVVVQGYAADYEGAVNVKNSVTDTGASGHELVWWVTGVMAGTAVNASATAKAYNGEYTVSVPYTQTQLENAIKAGEFVLHKTPEEGTETVRVLKDINSLVTTSDTKGDVFKSNQTIRVIDQIANDTAVIFNGSYLGKVPNDAPGREALRTDIVSLHESLADLRAIQDFNAADITIAQGDDAVSVVVTDAITVVNAMEKLYMTVTVA